MVSDREVRLAMADVHENYRRWIEEMNEQNRHAANGGPWVRHDPETSKRTVIGLRPGHGLRLYDPDRGGMNGTLRLMAARCVISSRSIPRP
jgi:hypothetical protein